MQPCGPLAAGLQTQNVTQDVDRQRPESFPVPPLAPPGVQAAPIVSAAAALAQSTAKLAGKTLTHTQLKQYITSADTVDKGTGNCASTTKSGRLNLAKIVEKVAADYPAYSPPPPPPSPPPPPPPSPPR